MNAASSKIDPFFGPQGLFPLSKGSMALPCHFRDVHYAVVLFAVERERLVPFLDGKGLSPALPWGGRSVVALGLIQYRESDLGTYDEVILAIPSVRTGEEDGWRNWPGLLSPVSHLRAGMHIIHIPVTTERSRRAGVECWGYPKTVLPIDHDLQGKVIRTRVLDEQGKTILTCSGSKGFSIPIPSLQLVTYSFLNGTMLRTPVNVRGGLRYHPMQRVRLRVGDSDHGMARDLRLMGLDGKKALVYLDCPRFQAVFGAGVPV
jgi:hypothetical protein